MPTAAFDAAAFVSSLWYKYEHHHCRQYRQVMMILFLHQVRWPITLWRGACLRLLPMDYLRIVFMYVLVGNLFTSWILSEGHVQTQLHVIYIP